MRRTSHPWMFGVCLVAGILLWTGGCKKSKNDCIDCIEGPAIDSAAALIEKFEVTYRRRDYNTYTTLLSNPTLAGNQAQPAFLFLLAASQGGESAWGYTEEVKIHRHMFRPDVVLPGETPIPSERWLQSVDIVLTQQTDFVERRDLYRSNANPGGLDSLQWTATEAVYTANVFFQLAGSTDYHVNGRASFVVIEDKTKTNADPGKWLIYRWEDLGQLKPRSPSRVEPSSWSALKNLYR